MRKSRSKEMNSFATEVTRYHCAPTSISDSKAELFTSRPQTSLSWALSYGGVDASGRKNMACSPLPCSTVYRHLSLTSPRSGSTKGALATEKCQALRGGGCWEFISPWCHYRCCWYNIQKPGGKKSNKGEIGVRQGSSNFSDYVYPINKLVCTPLYIFLFINYIHKPYANVPIRQTDTYTHTSKDDIKINMNRCSTIFFLNRSRSSWLPYGWVYPTLETCGVPLVIWWMLCYHSPASCDRGQIWLDSPFLGALIFRADRPCPSSPHAFCLEFYEIAWNQGRSSPSCCSGVSPLLLFLNPSLSPSSLQTSSGHKDTATYWGLGTTQGL